MAATNTTIRERIANYLERQGYVRTITPKRWVYSHPSGGKRHYLGPSGSWRRGLTVASSVPVSEALKRSVTGQ
jgi:hypothetical protein